MKYGVAYDPEVWGYKHDQPFAEFTWAQDAERYAEWLSEVENIDYVVVEL